MGSSTAAQDFTSPGDWITPSKAGIHFGLRHPLLPVWQDSLALAAAVVEPYEWV